MSSRTRTIQRVIWKNNDKTYRWISNHLLDISIRCRTCFRRRLHMLWTYRSRPATGWWDIILWSEYRQIYIVYPSIGVEVIFHRTGHWSWLAWECRWAPLQAVYQDWPALWRPRPAAEQTSCTKPGWRPRLWQKLSWWLQVYTGNTKIGRIFLCKSEKSCTFVPEKRKKN